MPRDGADTPWIGVSLSRSRGRAHPGRRCRTVVVRHRRPEPISEFVSFLVREGHVGTVMVEHVAAGSGRCRRCGAPWPCYWRKLAAAALPLACKRDR
jgi:hypothetical protein